MAVLTEGSSDTDRANRRAMDRLFAARPVLVDVLPASEALPGMTAATVLTSGPAMAWAEYRGGQRDAVLGGVLYEGLAGDAAEADRRLADGSIRLAGCQEFDCVGSVAGVTTASMPVLVVRDTGSGHRGFCTLYEGDGVGRLNYGVYDDGVRRNLRRLGSVIGPGARLVGGADLSFLVAGIVAALLYPLAVTLFPEPAQVYGPNPGRTPK